MGPRCTWLFLFYLICVIDGIKGFPYVVDIGVFCCLFIVCVYICSAGYVELAIVLLFLLRCLVHHMLFKTRRNSGSLHGAIGEVLVLGLLVYKIPYSS